MTLQVRYADISRSAVVQGHYNTGCISMPAACICLVGGGHLTRRQAGQATWEGVSRHVSPPLGEPGYVSPAACELSHVSPAPLPSGPPTFLPSTGRAERLPPPPPLSSGGRPWRNPRPHTGH